MNVSPLVHIRRVSSTGAERTSHTHLLLKMEPWRVPLSHLSFSLFWGHIQRLFISVLHSALIIQRLCLIKSCFLLQVLLLWPSWPSLSDSRVVLWWFIEHTLAKEDLFATGECESWRVINDFDLFIFFLTILLQLKCFPPWRTGTSS